MSYKYYYLTLVSAENNNKFYEARWENQADDTFVAKYGRVNLTSTDQIYAVDQWDKKYKEKIKKGYRDLTTLRAVTKSSSTFRDLDSSIAGLISKLQSYSSNAVKTNYTIAVGAVTPLQLQAAQQALNDATLAFTDRLTRLVAVDPLYIPGDYGDINNSLLELYTILPRKMDKVQYHLINDDQNRIEWIKSLLANEQDVLDSLATQVTIYNTDDKDDQTILTALGLEVSLVTDGQEIETVKKLMTDSANLFSKLYKINNIKTYKGYTVYRPPNKTLLISDERLLFHSSRNANWLSILENGLLIRPSGVATTGSMLGDAIYFADRAKKSIGYSSLENSYWAGGNSKEAYLALYNVYLGKSLKLQSYADLHTYSYQLNYNDLNKLGYNSVFADASRGGWLYNNEYTIYQPNQCTIEYLIELKK